MCVQRRQKTEQYISRIKEKDIDPLTTINR